MENLLIRNMTKEQSDLIDAVMDITGNSTGTKAVMTALADYVKIKEDIENYKSDEMAKYILMMSQVKTSMDELQSLTYSVQSAVRRCENDLSY